VIDPKTLDDFAKRLSEVVPQSARDLHLDIEKNLRAVITSTFNKLNLVTREEFEIQQNVLLRTRNKVENLEQQIIELENKLLQQAEESLETD
jgi:ubiquinone biosynthesis accessory factor UbiK